MRSKDYFKSIIKTFPLQPGVYIMKNDNGDVIYVGKAKKLKNRVSSYFNNNIDPESKVAKMVAKIYDIDYIVTNNELEALVLECNLIKKYKPLYNILLKDDKGYKFIKISPPPYSKITVVNYKQAKDRSTYIGPYMSNFTASQIVQTVCQIFKLPTCNRDLIHRDKYSRPCLNYYINLCCAPCCNRVSLDEYQKNIDQAVKYMKSGMKPVIKELKDKMIAESKKLNFELAAKIRDQIKAIEKVSESANVIISQFKDIDVLAVIARDRYICATLLMFRDYKLMDKKQYLMKNDEELGNVRKMILMKHYVECDNKPPVIYLDEYPKDYQLLKDYVLKDMQVILHEDKQISEIMSIAINNSKERILQEIKLIDKDLISLSKLKDILKLKRLPRIIEAYDISNFGSQVIVGAMVVFIDGKPKKSLYKKFKIKDVHIQNDYKSMEEMIERRLKRYLSDQNKDNGFDKLPDLMLIDGGKEHVDVAYLVLERYGLKVPVYGMVKDNKHATDMLVNVEHDNLEIKNDKDVFLFIKRIQDEMHRFAITYSRKSHEITSLKSVLSQIPGVGEVRIKSLLRNFKSLDNIKNASLEELANVDKISINIAKVIFDYFHNSGLNE